MSSEEEQIQQRHANLTKLAELGVNFYPHRFERTATVTDLVRAHGEKTGPQLEEQRVDTVTSGRILGIRSF
jgi:lysyl-tRNA synthetase class II